MNLEELSIFLCISSFSSFLNALQFSSVRSFTSLVKFIPWYLNASLSYWEWDWYYKFKKFHHAISCVRKGYWFFVCVLIHPATLPNSEFQSSRSRTFRFPYLEKQITANKNKLTSSFWIYIPLISLVFTMAKTSRTILNISGESWHPSYVPYLSGDTSNLSPFRILLVMGFHIWPLVCRGIFRVYSICLMFLSWKAVLFGQMLSLHLLR